MSKEELKEYRKILIELRGIKEAIENITLITSSFFENNIKSKGKPTSIVENSVSKLIELEDRYKDTQDRLLERLGAINEFIEGIEDSTIRDIFRRRYILGERWEKISLQKYISIQHCIRLHNNYLKDVNQC